MRKSRVSEAQIISDDFIELLFAEAAWRESVGDEGLIFLEVELSLGLESGDLLDLIRDGVRCRLNLKRRCLVPQDQRVPHVVFAWIPLFPRREDLKQLHEPKHLRDVRLFVDPGEISARNVLSIDAADATLTQLFQIRLVVKEDERDDDNDGDEHHQPALILPH